MKVAVTMLSFSLFCYTILWAMEKASSQKFWLSKICRHWNLVMSWLVIILILINDIKIIN